MSAVAQSVTALARLGGAQAGLPGGPRSDERRRAALQRLVALGLPTPRDEAWKYTNLRLLERRDLAPAPPRPLPAGALSALPPRQGPTLVFVDGRFHPALSSTALPDGVEFTPLATLLAGELPPAIEARVGAGDSVDERIRLMNAALLGDGALLTFTAGRTPELPLHLVHVATGGGAYPRLLVSIEAGAAARLVEYHLTLGDSDSVAIPVTDLVLGASARLEHYSIGLAGPRAIQLEDVAVRLDRDAEYQHLHVGLGGQLARLDLRVRLEGHGAATQLAGLFIADRSRQLDIRTRIDHLAAHTTSDQVYRGVANDRGRGSYDGMVVVHPGAIKADSQQSSRNLLLGPQASIDARPQLEIKADDVKCSHGAATGALDEQMLFYLLSRGLDRDTARALLTFAFAGDVITRLRVPELRPFVAERVLGSLPTAPLIREFVQ
ncbi:MAG TPA: Fe-S cluster assembly protein SufD [Steroidobacteraceae bacterium]|nr:Fe-S cluster assembly protein SufD [Steroidobacteraceae bacterium]